MGVGSEGDTKGPGQAEVGQLEVALAIDKEVLGLEVAMEDAVAVAVADTGTELAHELLDHGVAETKTAQIRACTLGKGLAAAAVADGQSLHVLLQIEVKELTNQVELMAVGVDNVVEGDDVRVSHLLQQGDLADGSAGDALILGLKTDLLQRHYATTVGEIAGLVDDTVGAWLGQRSVSIFRYQASVLSGRTG